MHSTARDTADWKNLPEAQQAALAGQAMQRAALIIAEQAELFAVQFRAGVLQDRGAADALVLFAALLLETTQDGPTPMGNA